MDNKEDIALGLLCNGDAVLLVKQDFGLHLWTIPGGRMEPGERFVDCAVREFREETGLEVCVTGLAAFSERAGLTCAVFTVECTGGELIESGPEVEATRWFTPTGLETAGKQIEDYTRMILERVFGDELHPLAVHSFTGRHGRVDLFT